MTADSLLERVTSVCVDLGFIEAKTPFSFELQPNGEIDRVFRVESASLGVLGGFNYTEERTDLVTFWVARKHQGEPTVGYRLLAADVGSIRTAVIRDGIQQSGEYIVPDDGFSWEIAREPGSSYAVLRLQVPLNYEAEV